LHVEEAVVKDIVGDRQQILVRQVKEWSEILVGFEARNRFEICSEAGETLGYAAEEGRGVARILARNFLGKLRSCTIHVYDRGGTKVGRGEKLFRWYFHRMDVYDGSRKLGAIQRQLSVLHRKFRVEGADGTELVRILSPFLRVWTFKVVIGGQEVARIRKRWGGVTREMFTDADTFAIEFTHPVLQQETRNILLVAVFLIDFVCFENNSNRGGLLGG
jgi:uncharacterized protein YxjI